METVSRSYSSGMETEFVPDGFCGLYCGSCPQFLAAKSGTLPAGQIECHGCRSGQTAEWCSECGIKNCARNKGIEFCLQCDEYPCGRMKEFASDSDYPYHGEVYSYLDTIKRRGKDAWVAEMKKRWSCATCGREASWWGLSCEECGSALSGYKKPEKKQP